MSSSIRLSEYYRKPSEVHRRDVHAKAHGCVKARFTVPALDARALRYSRDDHYDVVSAFIKSIRGSDPDAGLYWLARMLAAGEDARFIARRLVILASVGVPH